MNLIETGNHEVNAERYPDLRAHGVLGGAEEGFDAQVLFDPFEEKFDLPTAFVYDCDNKGGQFEVVGEKNQPLASFRIDIADTPKRFGIITFPFQVLKRIVCSHRRPVVLSTVRDFRTLKLVLLLARITKDALACSMRYRRVKSRYPRSKT